MPTYSYRCTECGTAFDIQQAFTDDSLTVCPTAAERCASCSRAVGVTFNGSGFYRNDSRAAATSRRRRSDAAPSSRSELVEPDERGRRASTRRPREQRPRSRSKRVKGFREFILRGNVIDLAVAVVIGAAFTAIVNALVTRLQSRDRAIFNAKTSTAPASRCAAERPIVLPGAVISALIKFVLIAASSTSR